MDTLLILCTAGSPELALQIARALVEEQLAACVNLLPGVRSVYRWEGEIRDDAECLLLIKSSASLFELVRARIRQLHSYQVPEIIALPVETGDADYLAWLRGQLIGHVKDG